MSKAMTAYVHADWSEKLAMVNPIKVRVTLNITIDRATKPTDDLIYVYNRYRGERDWTLLGTTDARLARPGRAKAVLVAQIDPDRPSRITACSATTFAIGMGRPRHPEPRCGARRIRKMHFPPY